MKAPLFWVDMEFTGLDPAKNKVLEIASVVTDQQLKKKIVGPVIIIKQPDEVLDSMDEWNTKHHSESGLTQKSRHSDETVEVAQKKTLDFLKKHSNKNEAPLCGNSIHMDRCFMKHHMPLLDEYLHYRNIDVSTLKQLIQRWRPEIPKYEKKNTHRAQDDIMASISELKYYREKLGL